MYILMLSLIFALLVAIFAVQNAAPVPINIFWAVKEVPLVLVIFASAVAGALIVFLLALGREFKRRKAVGKEKVNGEVVKGSSLDAGSEAAESAKDTAGNRE
ncbi:MAG: LapA family protein [Desulfitobacteriaceae bacterium]